MHQVEIEVIQTFRVQNLEELTQVAQVIIDSLSRSKIVLLKGEMGSGKTTLVKAIMAEMKLDQVSSPTFSIVNRYDTESGPFYHFDLYRIEDIEELYDIGFEEYIESGHPCLIEWPQLIEETIDSPITEVEIQLDGDTRFFKISIPEA